MKASLAFSALLVGFAMTTPASAKQLPPVDACKTTPSFWAFRAQFADIVKRRDAKALIALTHPRIKNSFGGDGGTAEFIEMWELDKLDRNSTLWSELDEILKLGCNASEEAASMPYFFNIWPEDKDVFESVITRGTNIALRAGPSTKSKFLTRLSWEVVTIARHPTGEEPEHWTRVRTDAGQIGYVHNDYLRSSIDYRALFDLIDGKWVMTALIAGD